MTQRDMPCRADRMVERLRYFHGQLLTARDFEDEQAYQLDKARAHNRLHGYGTVCGLAVVATDPPSTSVVVEPGVALDCCGREIVLTRPLTVDIADLAHTVAHEGVVYVTIEYDEEAVKPVLTPGIDRDDERGEASRIQEVPRVAVIAEPAQGSDDSRPHVEGVVPCPRCLDAAVVLARVDLTRRGPIEQMRIDNTVRRIAATAAHQPPQLGVAAGAANSQAIAALKRRVAALGAAVGVFTAGVVSLVLRSRD